MASWVTLALVIPALGAVGVLCLTFSRRLRSSIYPVGLAVSGLVVILLLAIRWLGVIEVNPLAWRPLLLLGVPPFLRSDAAVQSLALSLALAVCGSVCLSFSRLEEPRPLVLAATLALASAGLMSLWAATPLTVIIGWAAYDLLQAAGLIAAGGSARVACRGMTIGGVATLLVWGGALFLRSGSSALWALMTPGEASLTLWMAACVLRLWIYPFHLAAPDSVASVISSAPLFLNPLLGWGLCLRIVQANGGRLPCGEWATALGAVSLAVGGFVAWIRSGRAMWPWIGIGVNGAILLAAGLGGRGAAPVVAGGGVVWVLAMTALFFYCGWRRDALWWNAPALIGALSLLGAPLTLGFLVMAALLEGVGGGGSLWWGGAVLIGYLFLVPALARGLAAPFTHRSSPAPRWQSVVEGIGWFLPALPLVVGGFYPPLVVVSPALSLGALFARPGVLGWLLWGGSLAGGGILAWRENSIRPRLETLFHALYEVLRLEWLYRVVAGALDRGLSALHVADDVVGGTGALLWSLLLFMLILLIGSYQ